MKIGDIKIYNHYTKNLSGDTSEQSLVKRNGQEVKILRQLVDGKEVDETEVGAMFRVLFKDGFELDVFEDELHEREG